MPRAAVARTSVRDALESAAGAFAMAGCDTPGLDAEVLLAAALGVDRGALISDPGRGLEPAEAARFAGWARRRRAREPVAYILGRRGFRTIDLEVDPRVLIPRPETEHLVEAALELPRGARVLDVGTGSGAVALALKAERPDLAVEATDCSAAALAVAGSNAARLGLDVLFHCGDLLAGVEGPLAAVVSNPPYVRESDRPALAPEILRHEPAGALFAGTDGLDVIRRLVDQAAARSVPFVALEVGDGQAPEVARLFAEAGYAAVEARRDLAGIERIVVART